MSANSFVHRRRALLSMVLCVLLDAACDSRPAPTSPAPTSPSPSPTPPPIPGSTQYRVSGIVLDAAGGQPIANATMMLRYAHGGLTTRTGEDGSYAFSFQTHQALPNEIGRAPADVLGLLIVRDGAYWGDTSRGHWTTVQLIPRGTPDVLQNVRLRPVRTLAAGQSMGLSVEPDSSLSWDQEWEPPALVLFDTLQEEFHVSVQTDGLLTIDTRPENGGRIATLTCPYIGCAAWRVEGTISFAVEARWSPYSVRIEVPRASAPQRYEIRTSLR